MKLAISNIAWEAKDDESVYKLMQKYGYTGLEIAPTRILSMPVYDKNNEAKNFAETIHKTYNFIIPSMQSLWFGRTENMFESKESYQTLLNYTKKAIEFAQACNCSNLVFGSPKNRNIGEDVQISYQDIINFFYELGEYAVSHNTCVAIEPNPVIYNTNFINTTMDAIKLVKEVNSNGCKINMDFGTILYNNEDLAHIIDNIHYINHIHISEPYLKKIEKRDKHIELYNMLKNTSYNNFISIEMSKQDTIEDIDICLNYISSVFGD